jgi:hypothetical protein
MYIKYRSTQYKHIVTRNNIDYFIIIWLKMFINFNVNFGMFSRNLLLIIIIIFFSKF